MLPTMKTLLLTLSAFIGIFMMAPHSHAASSAKTYHILPQAAGQKDGSTWQHALGIHSAQALINETLKPGDQLHLGSGEYRDVEINLTAAGQKAAPIHIRGIDTGSGLPVFCDQWSEHKPDKGSLPFTFGQTAAWITLSHLHIRDCMTGITASIIKKGRPRPGLRFEHITMQRIRHGFYLSDCEDLLIQDCTLHHYTKHGYRLESGCSDVTLRRCLADCSQGQASWEKLTESLPFGYFANGNTKPNQRLTFDQCTALNNLMPHQTSSYKNGDGFVIEERTLEVRLVKCRAERNQDGGFDIKSKNICLEDCVALNNSRNFRLWSRAEMTGCFSGLASTGLWSKNGPITATHCTFHKLQTAVEVDDDANATIQLRHCLLHQVKAPINEGTGGQLDMDSSNRQDDQAEIRVP
jgi:hypothetical protein